jgi:hypothetical protein
MSPASRLRTVLPVVSLVAAWLALYAPPAAQGAAKTLAVEAGPSARANVPMSVDVPAGTSQARMMDGAREVPCQVADGKLWWILDGLAAGAAKTYTVDLGAPCAADPKAVDLKETPETVEIAIDGKPFTVYRFTNPKVGGVQIKRPYFWPVLGPDQTPMTRPWPCTDKDLPANLQKDHPHHTSFWVAYGDINGVDNWSNSDKAGWQVHRAFQAVQGGPVVGFFRETLDWTAADKKPVAAEVRSARIYRLPASARMLDLEVTFQAKYGKIEFKDTKEAGLCSIRVRTELVSDKGGPGRLVNAQGLVGTPAWGKRSEWIDYSGPVDGKTLGVALFDTPGNFRFPTWWHARTYGLAGANPFGSGSFEKGAPKGNHTIDEGKELTFRYRLYLHPGDEKAGNVAARYADYADPPKATWK